MTDEEKEVYILLCGYSLVPTGYSSELKVYAHLPSFTQFTLEEAFLLSINGLNDKYLSEKCAFLRVHQSKNYDK
jgi:hypothetical protein